MLASCLGKFRKTRILFRIKNKDKEILGIQKRNILRAAQQQSPRESSPNSGPKDQRRRETGGREGERTANTRSAGDQQEQAPRGGGAGV